MGPSDSLRATKAGYLFPAPAEASYLTPGPQGLPSSWAFFRCAPPPYTPESPPGRLQHHAFPAVLVLSFMGA
jgi:hypothetical protein